MKTLTMKNQTNHDFGLVIVDNDRSILPPQNDEYRTIAGRDGQEHIARDLGNIEMRVEFFRKNPSVKQWNIDRMAIANWLRTKGEVKIRVDDEPGIHFIGKVTEADLPTRYRPDVTFSVTFTMQPFRFGAVVDVTYPLITSRLHQNVGGYETPGLLTFKPSSTLSNPTFTVNDVALKYTGSIAANSVITIDSDALEFRINGVLKVVEVTGAFAMLVPGDNIIKLSSATAGTMQIQYTERSL